MSNKVARKKENECILEDMATFALEQVNSIKPMLFKDYLVRDNYTSVARRKACLCLKKLRDGYTELIDIVEIEIKFGNRTASYYIYDSNELEERVRSELESVGKKLKARMASQGIELLVLPRDACAEPLRR